MIDEELVLVDQCGWCGHVHAFNFDCGCKPCADCDEFHGGGDCNE